jgi:hypothetical protein
LRAISGAGAGRWSGRLTAAEAALRLACARSTRARRLQCEHQPGCGHVGADAVPAEVLDRQPVAVGAAVDPQCGTCGGFAAIPRPGAPCGLEADDQVGVAGNAILIIGFYLVDDGGPDVRQVAVMGRVEVVDDGVQDLWQCIGAGGNGKASAKVVGRLDVVRIVVRLALRLPDQVVDLAGNVDPLASGGDDHRSEPRHGGGVGWIMPMGWLPKI